MKTSKKTKKIRANIFLIALAALMTFATGCSKNNPLNPAGNCFDGKWAEQYTSELEMWSAALTTYSENPSEANCAEYRNATKAYLDALENIYDCVPTVSRTEFDQAIKEAKADLDNEDCNG